MERERRGRRKKEEGKGRREGERAVDGDEKGKENEGGRNEMVAVPSNDAEEAAAIGERERERYRG